MISPKDLEELAILYDEGAQSIDPKDPRAMQAMDEFDAKLESHFIFFESRRQTAFREFRRVVIGQCKAFLKKNK